MKRITSAICTAAAVFSAIISFAPRVFADDANGIAVSETALRQGDEFTVSLTVPPAENADTASLRVLYDDSAFEGLEFEPDVSGSFTNISGGIMALSAANAERAIILTDGLTLTAKFRVRNNAPDGDYDFVLAENSFCYLDEETWDFVELWFPETTKISVTVGSPEAAATPASTPESTGPEPAAESSSAPPESTTAAYSSPAPISTTTAADTMPASESTSVTAKTENAEPVSSANSVFVVIVIVLIVVGVAAVAITVITLFKPQKDDK